MNPATLSDAVHVWHIHKPLGQQTEHPTLGPAELERAARLQAADYREQWCAFHSAMRDILSRYAGSSAASLKFGTTERGKPTLLTDSGLFFNLSHSGDFALLALTRCAPVGIDIERHRPLRDRPAMIRRYFSAREQQAIMALPPDTQETAFFDTWTRKEAIIKANGLGLGLALDAFDVPLGTLHSWHRLRLREADNGRFYFQLKELPIKPGFSAAVSLETAGNMNRAPHIEPLSYPDALPFKPD